MLHDTADVIVVGAGPAGATAAFFLAQAGVDVLLVDRATFPRDKVCGDGVCPRAVAVMHKMGLRDWIETSGFPEQRVRLGAPDGATIDVPEMPNPEPNARQGYLIPRMALDHALVNRAVEAGARLIEGTRITELDCIGPQQVRVLGDARDRAVALEAPLVIAADGALSGFTRRLGLVPGPPDIVAIRQYFEGIEHEEPGLVEIHWEQSVLPGYAWIFHLGNGRANVGIGMHAREAKKRRADLHGLLQAFAHNHPCARRVLHCAHPQAPARGFPLRTDAQRVTPWIDNVLVAGEAAGVVNPLNGEGIGPAMVCGELAAWHAQQALARGDFSKAGLAPYGRAFHATFDSDQRAAHLFRKILAWPWLINRTLHRAQRDPVLAATLRKTVHGAASSLSLLRPGAVLGILFGSSL